MSTFNSALLNSGVVVSAEAKGFYVELSNDNWEEVAQLMKAIALKDSGTVYVAASNNQLFEKFESERYPHGRRITVGGGAHENFFVLEEKALSEMKIVGGNAAAKFGNRIPNAVYNRHVNGDQLPKSIRSQYHFLRMMMNGETITIKVGEDQLLWDRCEREFTAALLKRQGKTPPQIKEYLAAQVERELYVSERQDYAERNGIPYDIADFYCDFDTRVPAAVEEALEDRQLLRR